MYVPGISDIKKIYPRKGGGGKGGGKGGGSGSGSGSSSGSGIKQQPVSGITGNKNTVSAYSYGGGTPTPISSGPFTGRVAGGGTRDNIYGNRAYGSGYPGVSSYGVGGRGFPFYFWPLAWGGGLGYGAGYIHNNEYGNSDNSSRPGGPMFQSTFSSNTQNTTFFVIADNTTTLSLVESIQANCSSVISNSTSATPIAYNSSDRNFPQPEQVVQYYRASSVALLLGGYNNSAALTDDQSAPDTPLPSNIDTNMLACLNGTIGLAVPLVDGALGLNWSSGSGLFGLVWVFWCLSVLL